VSRSTLTDVYAHSASVVGRRMGDELVLVPLAGRGADIDSILNLNKVGAFIWEQLDGNRSGAAVVDALVDHFEVERAQAEEDYLGFLTTLRSLTVAVSVPGGRAE
jgi:hypothetical protein